MKIPNKQDEELRNIMESEDPIVRAEAARQEDPAVRSEAAKKGWAHRATNGGYHHEKFDEQTNENVEAYKTSVNHAHNSLKTAGFVKEGNKEVSGGKKSIAPSRVTNVSRFNRLSKKTVYVHPEGHAAIVREELPARADSWNKGGRRVSMEVIRAEPGKGPAEKPHHWYY